MEFWRTEHWLEYLLNSKIGTVYIDRSFYLGNKFVPLIQDGSELYSPGFDDDKEILQRVKEIALDNGIKRIQVDSQIKSYLNISGYTCIVDPFNIKPSKGHKSAIKTGQKHLEYEIVTRLSEFNHFMLDYYEIAGKQTRPKRTFLLLYFWAKDEYGALLKATYQDKTAGYAYILHYQGEAYYFMGGIFEQYKQYNVSHYLQSVAFESLRNKGIKTYELGDQVYDSLMYQPSEKERHISEFKRHFGGEIMIKAKSELFFCKNYFEEIMNQRIQAYKERIL
jgi:hypothetical protein